MLQFDDVIMTGRVTVGYYLDYHHGALSLNEITTTNLKMGQGLLPTMYSVSHYPSALVRNTDYTGLKCINILVVI